MGPMFTFMMVYLSLLLIGIFISIKELRQEIHIMLCFVSKTIGNICTILTTSIRNRLCCIQKTSRKIYNNHIENPISDFDATIDNINIEITDYIVL